MIPLTFPRLAGNWICSAVCAVGGVGKPARIEQTSAGLRFINESGRASSGQFDGPQAVIALQWDNLRADVKDDAKALHWHNGTIWRRAP
jgi:hypothetical protein